MLSGRTTPSSAARAASRATVGWPSTGVGPVEVLGLHVLAEVRSLEQLGQQDSARPARRPRGRAARPSRRWRRGRRPSPSGWPPGQSTPELYGWGSSSAFRSRFMILPFGLRGSGSSRNQIRTGTLKAAIRSADERPQLLFGRRRARGQVDDGADLLAEHVVGDADRRRVGHGRVLEQGGFDLDAVDVLAAADDHVLGPVDDVDEALVVDAGDVARVQPAVGDRRRRRLRLVPVALDDVGTLDPQLADLARRQQAGRRGRRPARRRPGPARRRCRACAGSRRRRSSSSPTTSRSARSRSTACGQGTWPRDGARARAPQGRRRSRSPSPRTGRSGRSPGARAPARPSPARRRRR